MQIYQIIYQISLTIYNIIVDALDNFGINVYEYLIIIPKWLPQIFKQVSIIAIGADSYPFIQANTILKITITITVWYLCISITYKFFKKLFKLGFGAFGL